MTSSSLTLYGYAGSGSASVEAALTALGQPCPELDLVYMLQQEQTRP